MVTRLSRVFTIDRCRMSSTMIRSIVSVVEILTARPRPSAMMNNMMNNMFGSTDLTMLCGLLTVLTMEKLLFLFVVVRDVTFACPPRPRLATSAFRSLVLSVGTC